MSYWQKYVHEVLINRLGGLSLPRKSVVRLTDRPNMTLDAYCGRKTTTTTTKSSYCFIAEDFFFILKKANKANTDWTVTLTFDLATGFFFDTSSCLDDHLCQMIFKSTMHNEVMGRT